jgi:hypothetical protein
MRLMCPCTVFYFFSSRLSRHQKIDSVPILLSGIASLAYGYESQHQQPAPTS